jgi:anti-sigma regulatory factor (Ser/Thr protein kinase)
MAVPGANVAVLSFELAAVPASAPLARRRVEGFAAEHVMDADVLARVALAFTEAFTNAVRHAYVGGVPRDDDISVSADVEDGTLEVVVIDHGAGIRAGHSQGGLGAGLAIVAECTDAFAIREGLTEGTEVWMQFRLPAA